MKAIILLVVLVLVVGCDCGLYSIGTVINAETLEPIDSIDVYRPGDLSGFTFTDSSGLYIYDDYQEGARCPDFELIFEKEGFIAQTLIVENGSSDTMQIEMEPE